MKLPYVIDKQTHVLADILKDLLTEHKGRSLDMATAYFTVGGLWAGGRRSSKSWKFSFDARRGVYEERTSWFGSRCYGFQRAHCLRGTRCILLKI
jgi:hypothetical protein